MGGKLLHRSHYKSKIPETARIFKILINKPSFLKPGMFDYMAIGTGFFISRYGIFLTAKHNFTAEVDDGAARPAIAADFQGTGLMAFVGAGKRYDMCAIVDIVMHDTADVAVAAIVPPPKDSKAPKFAISLCALTKTSAKKGDEVHTYGYQRTKTYIDPAKPDNVNIDLEPRYYDGKIESHNPGGLRQYTWSIYVSTMPIPGGVSGGPVFNNKDKVVGIACSGIEVGDTDDVEHSYISDISAALDLPLGAKARIATGCETVNELVVKEGLIS